MRFHLENINLESTKQWKSKYKKFFDPPPFPIPYSLWELSYHRGFCSEEQIKTHCSKSLAQLKSPWLLDDMAQAVSLLIKSFKKEESVCVYADFDLDGTSGLALFFSGLRLLGFKNISYFQPLRLSHGFGVHKTCVEELAQKGVQTLVTIDLGVTDIKAIKQAKKLGLNVIVTDHHLPQKHLPPADAIINPNKKGCSSGLGHLCGAGVAFYLLLALRQEMKKQGLLFDKDSSECLQKDNSVQIDVKTPDLNIKENFDPKQLLDCLAIATITDCVPLIKENSILVKHGLWQLSRTQRVGLRALLEKLGLWGQELTAQDVSFRFAPKLNALSRLEEEGLQPIKLFLEEDNSKAEELVDKILKVHQKRVNIQKKGIKILEEIFQEQVKMDKENLDPLKSQNLIPNSFTQNAVFPNHVWAWSQEFHQGVVGLLATYGVEKYDLSSFVGVQKENGHIVGSARAFSDESVLEALKFSQEVLIRFGGHEKAAGFELEVDKAVLFQEKLNEFFNKNKVQQEFCLFYDVKVDPQELGDSFMKWHDALGPYGEGFNQPLFLLEKMKIVECHLLKGGHFRLILQSHKNKIVKAIYFASRGKQDDIFQFLKPKDRVDLLVEFQWNYFMDKKNFQILVKDLKFSQ